MQQLNTSILRAQGADLQQQPLSITLDLLIHMREQAVALALYADYRAPACAADAAEARRLQAAFAARVRGMHARYEHGTLFQGEAAPGCIADAASAADGCAAQKDLLMFYECVTCTRLCFLLAPPDVLRTCAAWSRHTSTMTAHVVSSQREEKEGLPCSVLGSSWPYVCHASAHALRMKVHEQLIASAPVRLAPACRPGCICSVGTCHRSALQGG